MVAVQLRRQGGFITHRSSSHLHHYAQLDDASQGMCFFYTKLHIFHMNVLNDIYFEGENFSDYQTLTKLESLHYAVMCLIQTITEETILNRLFFSGMVKKLAQTCLENSNPTLLLLQQSSKPNEHELESLTLLQALNKLEIRLTSFFIRKNKLMFTCLFKKIYSILFFLRDIDCIGFNLSELTTHKEYSLQIEDYFCMFPEFRRYFNDTIEYGPRFIYRFRDI